MVQIDRRGRHLASTVLLLDERYCCLISFETPVVVVGAGAAGLYTALRAARAGTRVTLVGGIAGRYRATACGASCSPGEVSWVRGGVRYEVQAAVIGPERATLVAMANSAISAGPR